MCISCPTPFLSCRFQYCCGVLVFFPHHSAVGVCSRSVSPGDGWEQQHQTGFDCVHSRSSTRLANLKVPKERILLIFLLQGGISCFMFVVLKVFETSQLGGFLCCVFAFCVAFKLGEMHFSLTLFTWEL